MKRRQNGFTLIEILVALFIFALVALISGQLLSRTLSAQDQLQDRGERLALVHRAMQIIQRDLLQLTNRSIRDADGFGSLAPLLINTDGFIEMTRVGWRNPLRHRRSEMQRVSYRLEDEKLIRGYWHALDRGYDAEPAFQTLLEEVERVEFYVLDTQGEEHKFWPPQLQGGQAADPAAIILRFEIAPFGVVERIWQVPNVNFSAGQPNSNLPGGRPNANIPP
jgi:general secretion pathway protein J